MDTDFPVNASLKFWRAIPHILFRPKRKVTLINLQNLQNDEIRTQQVNRTPRNILARTIKTAH